jgi:hypothetical protein
VEAIYLVCGAGGPQLKRNPLDSTLTLTTTVDRLSRAAQVKLLRSFLAGEVSTTDLREQLSGHMSIQGDWASFSIEISSPLEVKVTVSPQDLRPMLERYLAYGVQDDELARWAALLLMLDPYTNPLGLTEKESDALMDPMWDVLWDLSVPRILGIPLRDRVAQALPELAKLQDELAKRAV